jgi:hypothetical protein
VLDWREEEPQSVERERAEGAHQEVRSAITPGEWGWIAGWRRHLGIVTWRWGKVVSLNIADCYIITAVRNTGRNNSHVATESLTLEMFVMLIICLCNRSAKALN